MGFFAVQMAFFIPYFRRIIPDFLLNIIDPKIQMIAFFTVKKHTWGHTYIKPAKWLSATWNVERIHANMAEGIQFLLHKQQQIQNKKMYFESTGWITKNVVWYWLVKIKNATISFEAFGGKVGLGQVKVCVRLKIEMLI